MHVQVARVSASIAKKRAENAALAAERAELQQAVVVREGAIRA
jgi:hypothetical protein